MTGFELLQWIAWFGLICWAAMYVPVWAFCLCLMVVEIVKDILGIPMKRNV